MPKTIARYVSDATIAHNAGQTLAGLFLMRVAIEQHWRSILGREDARMTGEELGENYKATLPEDFKTRHPTLTDTYSNLSGAIHSANADAKIYESARKDILKHFEALPHFLQTDIQPDSSPAPVSSGQ